MLSNKHANNDPLSTPKWSNNTTRNDRLVTQKKSAPAGAETPVIPGLTATKERLMTQRIKTPQTETSKVTARLFLELSADDLERAKRTRDYYVTLASKYGLSNVEIGRALGVSEARVRQILSEAHRDIDHMYGGDK